MASWAFFIGTATALVVILLAEASAAMAEAGMRAATPVDRPRAIAEASAKDLTRFMWILSLQSWVNQKTPDKPELFDHCQVPGQRPGDLSSMSSVHELFVTDEPDSHHAVALCKREHLSDGVVVCTPIRAHVQLGLRTLGGLRTEIALEILEPNERTVPDDRAVPVDIEANRLDGHRFVLLVRIRPRHVQLHRMRHDRQREDEQDEQDQQDVDERRRVHLDHRFAFAAATYLHRHDLVPLTVRRRYGRPVP